MKKIIFTLSIFFLLSTSQYAQNNHTLDANGTNNYVQVNDFELGGNFTISFWLKCNASSLVNFEERIISFGPSPRLELGIDNDGENDFWLFDAASNTTLSFGPNLRDDAWHHVAFVRSDTERTIYVDGEEEGQYFANATIVYGSFFRMNAWTGGLSTSTFFNGKLDEVRIWSVAKTTEEIVENMSCQLSGEEDNLIAYWNFDQGTPGEDNLTETTLIDLSNNGRDGTLLNYALTGNSSNWLEADNAGLFYPDVTVNQNGNELMAAEANVEYQWWDCNSDEEIAGETNQTFTPETSGSYAVEISNGSCSEISECMDLTIVSVTNIQEKLAWNIYPNPTSDVLFVETKQLAEVSIVVSNTHGKTLLETTSTDHLTEIDLSEFGVGAYFIQLKEKEKTEMKKFIKLN